MDNKLQQARNRSGGKRLAQTPGKQTRGFTAPVRTERGSSGSPSKTGVMEQAAGLIDRGGQAIHNFFDSILLWAQAKALQARSYTRLTARRIRRAAHEKRARRFPESDSWPVQVFLMCSGVFPMLGNKLKARLWRLRRRSMDSIARLRSRGERKKLHPAAFLASAGTVAALALFFSMYTFGTTVEYDGNVIAKTTSVSAVEAACAKLEQITSRTLGSSYTIDSQLLHFSTSLVSRDQVVDENALEEELSDQIGLVTYGYALYVDGEFIGATPYEGALEELLQQLKSAVTGEDTISCEFKEDVEVRAEYVPNEKIMNLGYIAELLNSTKAGEVTYTVAKGDTWSEIAEDNGLTQQELLALNPGYDINKIQIGEVLTISNAVPYLTMTLVQRERYVENVPYEIEYQDSAYLYQGDYKVLSAGEYGSADVVANVTYVNGEETQRDILSFVTLANPTTEVQARGTKERPTWIATGNFRWPCSGNITSRFGYRNLSYSKASKNHKGIDIANRYGTAVSAADGGTVVYAGWMSGYGYLVQVDHGNGFVTYYGHNSSLLVSVGQRVYKGQQLARMGSTGNSTGNHCHFEVRYKGVPKNPLNYLS